MIRVGLKQQRKGKRKITQSKVLILSRKIREVSKLSKYNNALGLTRSRVNRIKKKRTNWGPKSKGMTQNTFK